MMSSRGVCTYLAGDASMCNCMNPIGRQWERGLSLPSLGSRPFFSDSPYSVSGRPTPTHIPVADHTSGPGALNGDLKGPPRRARMPPPPRHVPERSGLPSAVLGVGAYQSGSPSAVRGTPGVGCVGHCSACVGQQTVNATVTHTAPTAARVDMSSRRMLSRLH